MQSSVTFNKPKKEQFPCLKIAKGGRHIVLFGAPRAGTVVHVEPGMSFRVGDHITDWDENCFEPLDGSVTLSN